MLSHLKKKRKLERLSYSCAVVLVKTLIDIDLYICIHVLNIQKHLGVDMFS